MFTDGKYWSSLFENATFEAQWMHADRFVNYLGNGADNMSDYLKSYNAADSSNTVDSFGFKKTGYNSVSGSNWEIKDQNLSVTGSCAVEQHFQTEMRLQQSVQNAAAEMMRLILTGEVVITVLMCRYGTA